MPTPSGWSSTTTILRSGDTSIDSLLDGYRWSSLTVTFSFPTYQSYWSTDINLGYGPSYGGDLPWNSSFAPLSTSDTASFRTALNAWAEVTNIRFVETSETSSSVGDIRAAYGYTADLAGGEAEGYFPNNSPTAGDIWFNANASIARSAWTPGSYSYLTVVHELGHALGLKHPFSGTPTLPDASDVMSYTVMSYSAGAGTSDVRFNFYPTTPMVLDVKAIQYIYGANYATRSGDDVYAFGDSSTFHQTIWDGGGNDTITYSGSRNATIDLNPGHGSTIGLPVYVQDAYGINLYQVHNIWIAFGVSIENATGGAGQDVITGNAGANYLNGGMGNDIIYGGPGNDFFDWDDARGGSDIFYGGLGDDTFVFDSIYDQAIEYAGEGTDTVWVKFSYSIAAAANIERLFSFGNSAVILTGNTLDNVFQGTAGNDTINGAGGSDTVHYDGVSTAYQVALTSSGWTVFSTATGSDSLTSIESLEFSDRVLAWDQAPPAALTFSPADETENVAISTDVVVIFNEAIQRGTGSIVLRTAAGTVVATYDAASSANLSIAGSTLTINPTADLNYATGYIVVFASGSIKDLTGNSYAGGSSYNFTTAAGPDLTAPAAMTFSPADDTANVGVASNITLTFSEAVRHGAGSIVVKTLEGAVLETFDAATSNRLTISGNTLTIDPTPLMAYGTGYIVQIGGGAVLDLAGNSYVGGSAYNFTTTQVDPAIARSAYYELAQKFYVAYFGRAADTGGLNNMAQQFADSHAPTSLLALVDSYDSNSAVRDIINSFGLSSESQALYAGSDTTARVTAVYHFMFNREPDSGGLAFWVGAVDSGNLSLAQAALRIMQGAENYPLEDGLIIVKKIIVAQNFTSALDTPIEANAYAGDDAAASVRTVLGGVGRTTDTGDYEPNVLNTIGQLVAAHPLAAFQYINAAPDISLVGVAHWGWSEGAGGPLDQA